MAGCDGAAFAATLFAIRSMKPYQKEESK